MNIKLIKKIITEKKTKLTLELRLEKIQHRNRNITKLNKLIHVGAKLVCNEISLPLGTQTEIQNLDKKLG